jgi:hypothetical protein
MKTAVQLQAAKIMVTAGFTADENSVEDRHQIGAGHSCRRVDADRA